MLVKQACIILHKLIAYNSVKFSQSTSYSSISINLNDKVIKPLIHLNSQISKHGRTGNIKDAKTIFYRMPIKNDVSWTAMLTAYAENGQINNARKLFDEMPERNVASWNATITGYMRSKNGVEKTCELFSMSPDVVSWTAMLTAYAEMARLIMPVNCSMKCLDEMLRL
ncbi:putative tetratricopeptide-like helical domain superfamily [Helianthus debilis subsp. tardiflorus]